jgi:endonuclease/exonuclease/phosphatase family metal-dependent hydrolase
VAILVRTWNLFHGNTSPPGRRGYLREMVELATADDPGIVCFQEVPVWALRYLERWTGMRAFGAVAAFPRVPAEIGRWTTEFHHGLLRSALTGQANALLVSSALAAAAEPPLVVSERDERRVCQLVRVEAVGVVGNVHVTGGPTADEQFRRAVEFVAAADKRAILAGDANLRPGEGRSYDQLESLGFSAPLPGSIDQIVVRGLEATAPLAWPVERRSVRGRLLSDHAPVELTLP